jgi:hypothetical protein
MPMTTPDWHGFGVMGAAKFLGAITLGAGDGTVDIGSWE